MERRRQGRGKATSFLKKEGGREGGVKERKRKEGGRKERKVRERKKGGREGEMEKGTKE